MPRRKRLIRRSRSAKRKRLAVTPRRRRRGRRRRRRYSARRLAALRRRYSVREASEHGSKLVDLRRRYVEAKRQYKALGSELWKQQTSG